MRSLTLLLDAARSAHRRHRDTARLRRELATYTSPTERAELAAIFARHDG